MSTDLLEIFNLGVHRDRQSLTVEGVELSGYRALYEAGERDALRTAARHLEVADTNAATVADVIAILRVRADAVGSQSEETP